MGLTVLSRDAVANTSPSCAHAQSHIIRAWDLSTAIGMKPVVKVVRILMITAINLAAPFSSFNSNSLQVRSRDTDKIYRSSGLNAILVTVNE